MEKAAEHGSAIAAAVEGVERQWGNFSGWFIIHMYRYNYLCATDVIALVHLCINSCNCQGCFQNMPYMRDNKFKLDIKYSVEV